MILTRLTLLLCALVALTACSIGRPMPEAATYMVEIPPPAMSAKRRPETLSMGRVRIAPAFASRALVFRLDAVRYAADADNTFIADPGDLLGASMAAWLDRAGPFAAVTQPDNYEGATHVLEAVVTELYGDLRPERRAAAVVTVQFRLMDLTAVTPRARLERTLSRRVDLVEPSPAAVVKGYGSALGEILTELAADVSQAI
ncbi:ABC-type transport auxiliary lipoprotein family protein [Thiocystis violacea]|uniref:ABC-type transport auxiliary lipoprotein family protein n=1 Tax=Thiocystis violacea TaxID=13725 RepID=UPI001906454D|nr:ABC-type transport auxiliary lipoprotein family protein [Thiocystis violacea]MBK1723877.1 hypothetical protein [Thiocystis violacea]